MGNLNWGHSTGILTSDIKQQYIEYQLLKLLNSEAILTCYYPASDFSTFPVTHSTTSAFNSRVEVEERNYTTNSLQIVLPGFYRSAVSVPERSYKIPDCNLQREDALVPEVISVHGVRMCLFVTNDGGKLLLCLAASEAEHALSGVASNERRNEVMLMS